tara:strand:- start:1251 stop:1370 length:120 start_codon:yes stop_codon:yes gene_type:complete
MITLGFSDLVDVQPKTIKADIKKVKNIVGLILNIIFIMY